MHNYFFTHHSGNSFKSSCHIDLKKAIYNQGIILIHPTQKDKQDLKINFSCCWPETFTWKQRLDGEKRFGALKKTKPKQKAIH